MLLLFDRGGTYNRLQIIDSPQTTADGANIDGLGAAQALGAVQEQPASPWGNSCHFNTAQTDADSLCWLAWSTNTRGHNSRTSGDHSMQPWGHRADVLLAAHNSTQVTDHSNRMRRCNWQRLDWYTQQCWMRTPQGSSASRQILTNHNNSTSWEVPYYYTCFPPLLWHAW